MSLQLIGAGDPPEWEDGFTDLDDREPHENSTASYVARRDERSRRDDARVADVRHLVDAEPPGPALP